MLTDLPIDEIKEFIQDYDCLKFKAGQAVNLLQKVTGQVTIQETQRDFDETRKWGSLRWELLISLLIDEQINLIAF